MPPKARFTKDEIIEAALDIVRTDGFQALTARALGTKLGSSARPIFTVFQSMEEVQQEVIKAARERYNLYVKQAFSQSQASENTFKRVGAQYILFAVTEPKLFQLLFMKEQENRPDVTGVLPLIDENYERILDAIHQNYGLDTESAKKLYQHLWIYSHGIATLCATGMCRFTGEEISEMMTEVCSSILGKWKGGIKND